MRMLKMLLLAFAANYFKVKSVKEQLLSLPLILCMLL
jgi:hypothetical protein